MLSMEWLELEELLVLLKARNIIGSIILVDNNNMMQDVVMKIGNAGNYLGNKLHDYTIGTIAHHSWMGKQIKAFRTTPFMTTFAHGGALAAGGAFGWKLGEHAQENKWYERGTEAWNTWRAAELTTEEINKAIVKDKNLGTLEPSNQLVLASYEKNGKLHYTDVNENLFQGNDMFKSNKKLFTKANPEETLLHWNKDKWLLKNPKEVLLNKAIKIEKKENQSINWYSIESLRNAVKNNEKLTELVKISPHGGSTARLEGINFTLRQNLKRLIAKQEVIKEDELRQQRKVIYDEQELERKAKEQEEYEEKKKEKEKKLKEQIESIELFKKLSQKPEWPGADSLWNYDEWKKKYSKEHLLQEYDKYEKNYNEIGAEMSYDQNHSKERLLHDIKLLDKFAHAYEETGGMLMKGKFARAMAKSKFMKLRKFL